MKKEIKSKYLGMRFDEWTVTRVSRQAGGHLKFNLSKPSSDGISKKNITVRDNQMTYLSRGLKTVEDIIAGKKIQRNRFKQNVYVNSTYYVFPDKIK